MQYHYYVLNTAEAKFFISSKMGAKSYSLAKAIKHICNLSVSAEYIKSNLYEVSNVSPMTGYIMVDIDRVRNNDINVFVSHLNECPFIVEYVGKEVEDKAFCSLIVRAANTDEKHIDEFFTAFGDRLFDCKPFIVPVIVKQQPDGITYHVKLRFQY